jgi:hypothetical protein
MADYDTRSIPILDDIIEKPESEKTTVFDGATVDLNVDADADDTNSLTENNLDLFTDTSAYADSDEIEPQIGIIDDFDEDRGDEAEQMVFSATSISVLDDVISEVSEAATGLDEAETEAIESALIDFHRDAGDESTEFSDFTPAIAGADEYDDLDLEATTAAIDIESSIVFASPADEASEPYAEISNHVSGETEDLRYTLESVVDDIVKQLIPDLEQQLRFLVQQALEDRLPDTILDQLTTKNNRS